MPGTKLDKVAASVRDQMLAIYASYGRKVTASVDETDGTPKVRVHVFRPIKSIPLTHFRLQGIVVNIVVTR